jgi:hypothetical protein
MPNESFEDYLVEKKKEKQAGEGGDIITPGECHWR